MEQYFWSRKIIGDFLSIIVIERSALKLCIDFDIAFRKAPVTNSNHIFDGASSL